MISKLLSYANDFANFAGMGLTKEAYIRKLPGGRWRVFSEKGKNLGTYNSESAAKKRLKQIHFFKWKKASEEKETLPNGEEVSYSSVMRFLNKNYDEENVKDFQKRFKENFDRLYLEGQEEPEVEALEETLGEMGPLKKSASKIDLGPAEEAGRHLAAWVVFMARRIDPNRRKQAIAKLKKKIYYLNEYNMASKKTSQYSSLGQSLTIIKNVLLEHPAPYIRQVLNAIVKAL